MKMKTFDNLKTFLFTDESNDVYCERHQVKRVRSLSKLNDVTISKGFVCPRCEMKLIDDEHIVLRINDKWIPVEDYIKQEGITI